MNLIIVIIIGTLAILFLKSLEYKTQNPGFKLIKPKKTAEFKKHSAFFCNECHELIPDCKCDPEVAYTEPTRKFDDVW